MIEDVLVARLAEQAEAVVPPSGLRAGVERRHRVLRARRIPGRVGVLALFVVLLGSAAVVVDSGDRSTFGGAADAPEDGTTVPESGCRALLGTEPFLILSQSDPANACVAVSPRQDIRIWNKRLEPVTVEWVDGDRVLGSGESFSTGRIEHVLGPGDHELAATPYRVPTIRVVDPADSPLSAFEYTTDSLGPVRVGDTIDEAAAAYGVELAKSDLPCVWAAVGDPYSPLLLVGYENGEQVIIGIASSSDQLPTGCG